MKNNPIIDLEDLKEKDIYSLSMLMLYKLHSIPGYNLTSELPYLLDEDNLLKLCRYYGGKTITIPTVEELYKSMKTLLLYQNYIIENKPWKEALVASGFRIDEYRQANKNLKLLQQLVEEYNIGSREDYE